MGESVYQGIAGHTLCVTPCVTLCDTLCVTLCVTQCVTLCDTLCVTLCDTLCVTLCVTLSISRCSVNTKRSGHKTCTHTLFPASLVFNKTVGWDVLRVL